MSNFVSAWNSFNSLSMLYKENSDNSNKISFEGARWIIWRHNSEPIEPPAPVIITTLPCISAAINSGLGSTGSRPNKSMTEIFFNELTLIFPPTKSRIPGIDKTSQEYFSSL